MEWRGPEVANDFEMVLFRRFPELVRAKRLLVQSGAVAAALTGSGSAVFALFDEATQARNAARNFGGAKWRVFLSHTISRREYQAGFPVLPQG
jgi:4-diphosphocytidyl-2-C-methyl-D-erythritol kinase